MSNPVVAIFDTEGEAEIQQALDLAYHLIAHNDEPYATQTTKWAVPILRLDGKYDYQIADGQDYTGITTQAYNLADYATTSS